MVHHPFQHAAHHSGFGAENLYLTSGAKKTNRAIWALHSSWTKLCAMKIKLPTT